LSIQGGSDLGLFEINEAAQLVANSAAVDANIIFGAVIDDALGDEVRVTVIAAGLDESRSGRGGAGTARAGSGSGATPSGGGTPLGGAMPRPGRADPPRYVPDDSAGADDEPSGWDADTEMLAYEHDDAESDAMATAGLAAVLSAPVMPAAGNGAARSAGRHVPVLGLADQDDEPGETALYDTPEHLAEAYSPAPRSSFRAEGNTFDIPTSRRRPVVFEEDDDLDVPDFLK
jgi:cell division protein FtsZ